MELINLMWNWPKLELTPCLFATLIPLIHLIAFTLNNSYSWLVSWENIQAGIFCHRILQGLCDLDYWWLTYQMDWFNYTCVKDVRVCYGYWIKYNSKLFMLLLNWKKETNIKYYFTFMFVIYKYTNFDIMIIHNQL